MICYVVSEESMPNVLFDRLTGYDRSASIELATSVKRAQSKLFPRILNRISLYSVETVVKPPKKLPLSSMFVL